MRGLAVDRSESTPLHDQVAAEIRRAISEGEIHPGEGMPPAIDLAGVLKVNRNTVLRALRILRDEGIVDFTRGRGVVVTGTPQRSALVARVTDLIAYARAQGYRTEELVGLIERVAAS